MRIGMIDVDAASRGKVTYPNLPLMKISAFHKSQGDTVEWHQIGMHYDKVYISRIFSDEYTTEQLTVIDSDEKIFGGGGYAIRIENGREVYRKELDPDLPYEIEHQYPDYELYGITDTAYGFLTRGCPRGCDFCHVAGMQGRKSHTVATLNEFWNGQKNISLCDPNLLACPDWEQHLTALAESKAKVDFNQGLDVRLLTDEKCDALNRIKVKAYHFAWDRPQEDLREQLVYAKGKLNLKKSNTTVYILCNNGEPFEQDVARVEFVKSLRFQPYVMVYRGSTASDKLKRLKRYANNPYVCWGTPTFNDYVPSTRSSRYGKTGMKHNSKELNIKGASNE